ncbi:NAD(P)H dehydrogenase (quinone) [Entomortierella parvispora]|uniref:NAD(P)H dehydrogenase (Quinone) n=1 Tax=Entomortierella parvispora TaxID=205924 RepID=A0A9P3LY28_9FUNG|nr:NAD(P)H dehydrogenase (quinone) [Entomortierella parvispora]
MSKQILVVFGATGNQGGSVVKTFLEDPELSKKYHIRAVSRDVNKPAAKALEKKGAEIVQGDSSDASSLPRVLQGAHAVFLATFTEYVPNLKAIEARQGKAVADAAVAAGVKQIVFSSLPPASKLSNHKYEVTAFDSKWEIEQYIRTLPIKSTFFAPGSFMQNFQSWLKPRPAGDGTYIIAAPYKPTTELPLIDTAGDSGKWVASAVEHPDKYHHQVFSAATRLYTVDEIVQTISKVSGKTVKFQPISIDAYKGYLDEGAKEPLAAMNLYVVDFGYYGPDTKHLVEHSAKQARGHLTTFEEYLKKDPIHFD